MIMLYGFLILLVALIIVSLLVGWKVASALLHPRIYAYDTVVEEEIARGHFTREWYTANVHLEEFSLRSNMGYNLHCALWPRKDGTSFADGKRRVVVIVHGFTYCLLGGIKYASMFHQLGFDCVLYDHRNHGLSDHAPTTMGALEARDLAQVCSWAREHFGEDAILGTQGESMGAATVMLHAKTDKHLAFVVEDCGFSDLNRLMRFVLQRRYHLPVFPILQFAGLFFRLRSGVSFGDVSPEHALVDCAHVPMLLVHGDADELVPPHMLDVLTAAKVGSKTAWLVPGAPHAGCYRTDPSGYQKHLQSFLTDNGVL